MKSDISVQADYVNHQFHVWQENQWLDIKLPAEVQAALMRQVVKDCCQYFTQALQSQMSDVPPGLATLTQH